MKIAIISCLLLLSVFSVHGQNNVLERAKMEVDSIINLIDKEPSKEKRFQHILNIYGTSFEGFPPLLFDLYHHLLLIGQRDNDLMLQSNAWSFAGQGQRLTGSYIKALECHHKAIALAEELGNPMAIGYAQNQCGHIYKDREEFDKAIELYKSARINIAKGNNEFLSMWPQMNLGYVLMKTNQLDSALYFTQNALDITNKIGIYGYHDYLLCIIASIYSKKNDLPKARKIFEEAMKAADKVGSPRFFNNTYLSVAEHYYRHNQIDSCILYAKKAIDAVRNTSLSNLVLLPAKMLTDIYEKENGDSTLKYWKVYRAANDSLFSMRANQQVQMMTFEENQRQRDIEAEKVRYHDKVRMNILLMGMGAILLIALILYRNNIQRRKTNNILEKTLQDLKATQTQLIQSEKMASLGELTAGIAHEIQNPLNFVNNFSELSNELIDEMNEELNKGEIEEAKCIANDIKQNLEKINHHGKRADAIVKGMLQHSRKSEGQKEPTDINALCDEYLRLSYHGLRAKDKSFNATLITDFDDSLGKVNIVPQDVGRVIMNLLTNAFYAVAEKTKACQAELDEAQYQPTVSIGTKKISDKIEISIADNGNGIPAHIIDKIFQPFFTTKPTGQGTGLGLSLAYDIVKAHGGELKVTTKKDEGTRFIIYLPTV